MKRKLLVAFCCLFFSLTSQAQRQRSPVRSRPTFIYDLVASTGTYNDHAYSEIQLGLNWYVLDNLDWRNAFFTRFGSNIDSASGLDSSARWVYDSPRNENGFGIGLFAGPGVRISNKDNTGLFAEAGLTVKGAGLALGGGVKSIYHTSPGTDSNGQEFPKNETVVFLIFGAGGAF